MCLNMHIFTYYRSKRKNVIFWFSEFLLFSESWKTSLTSKESRKAVYRVFSSRSFKPSRGHDALDLIRLKWQNFRFQILLRQNVANYVYVTVYVLKYAYFHLLSLKAQKRVFAILWIRDILWISQFVRDSCIVQRIWLTSFS